MKTDIRKIMIIAAILVFGAANAFANNETKEDWKEKIQSEKIAFLTMEIGLTPQEAQVFWPVYNEINEEKDQAMYEVIKYYWEMSKAIEAGKSEKEIKSLLDKYLEAQEKQRKIDEDAAEKYKKVLSTTKVAKLYIGEEKFRRQHIRKLRDMQGQKK
ncbi:MAG: hypothetical protein IKY36_04295 [Bacteroidales bacterium]|jgi:hypothetical protein|nr:hypothetical protein [Bacteroidales bacterium]